MQPVKTVLVLLSLALPLVLFRDWFTAENYLLLVGGIQENVAEFMAVIALIKAGSIVYPPLPGIILTIAIIPIIGWQKAYLVDIVGSVLGVSGAYFLGKKYGKGLMKTILGEKITNKALQIKVRKDNQLEAATMLRIASGGSLSDTLAWGASLVGLRYWPYVAGHTIAHLITTLPIFFIVAFSLELKSWVLVVPLMVLTWIVIYKLKGRYFE